MGVSMTKNIINISELMCLVPNVVSWQRVGFEPSVPLVTVEQKRMVSSPEKRSRFATPNRHLCHQRQSATYDLKVLSIPLDGFREGHHHHYAP